MGATKTTWQVSTGYYDDGVNKTTVDLTDRVLGCSINRQAKVGQLGTANATITFDNSDGAMTPGGTGTYASYLWFERDYYIQALISEVGGAQTLNAEVFRGVAVDFDLFDDGRNSTVTISCVDVFQVAGRGSPAAAYTAQTERTTTEAINDVMTDTSDTFPSIGRVTPYWSVIGVAGGGTDTTLHTWGASEISGAVGDVINQNILPSGMLTAAPNMIQGSARLQVDRLAWSQSGLYKVDFDNDDTTLFPFRFIDRTFDVPELTNDSNVTTVGGVERSSANLTSAAKYGARARTYTVTADDSPSTGDDHAAAAAEEWANRFDDVTFEVREIVTTSAMIDDHLSTYTSANEYERLLRDWCWYETAVTYTPTGGTSTTEDYIRVGSTITVTPSDATIKVFLVPAANYTTFELDSTTYGVLDQNRLGAFS